MTALYTYGKRIGLSPGILSEYELIAVSAEDLTSSVMLKLTGSGVYDLSGLLDGRASHVIGSAFNDSIIGGAGADTLFGGLGNDTLIGGLGKDRLIGGGGDDRFLLGALGSGVNAESDDVFFGGTGTDRLVVGAQGVTVWRLVLDAAAMVEVVELQAALRGTDQADHVDLSGVLSITDGNGFNLRDDSIVAFDLGASDDYFVGNVLEGCIVGGDGNDTLIGGDGANFFRDGLGEDKIVCNGGDDVISLTGGIGGLDQIFGGDGFDTLYISGYEYSAIKLGKAASVEKVRCVGWFIGTDADNVFDFSGVTRTQVSQGLVESIHCMLGEGDDLFIGSQSWNDVAGDGGDDTLIGGRAYDNLSGGAGNDRVIGGSYRDRLWGNDGNDRLDGGSGADLMYGGAGSNVFVVDDVTDTVDNTEGDAATSWIETALASYTLVHTAAFDPVPNVWNLKAIGPNGSHLIGDKNENMLVGGNGNDTLDGGGDLSDTLSGGRGNDTYICDAKDKLVEPERGGIDTVISDAMEARLGNNFENLVLNYQSGALGVGNDLNNTITGSYGKDTLVGGKGADRMIGGDDDDIYLVDSVKDVVVEAGSTEFDGVGTNLSRYRLAAGVEGLFGLSADGQDLIGNELSNYIEADEGNDTLNGAAGADTLIGGLGNDVFVFGAPALGVDEIEDFTAGDQVQLDAGPSNLFAGLELGVLSETAFKLIGSGGKPLDGDDRVLYDKSTGRLYFDSDGSGSGAAQLFLVLTNHASLAATDILVV